MAVNNAFDEAKVNIYQPVAGHKINPNLQSAIGIGVDSRVQHVALADRYGTRRYMAKE